jgi:hypothetical protein
MPLDIVAQRTDMSKYALAVPALLVGCVLVLADCTPQAKVTTSEAQIPAIAPGTARVWFFRGWDSPSGQSFVYGAAPTIYANGAAVGEIPTGTDFFRDFPPGAYSFTVEPFGLPTPQAASLQLAAGTQNYLQVQWVASWEFGYPEVDFSFAPNTFGVLTASPQVAQAYLPTLSYLGQR